MSQSTSSSAKATRPLHHPRSSSKGIYHPKISLVGMKVIQKFHLQDVLRKQEERVKINAAHHTRTRQSHLKKVNTHWLCIFGIFLEEVGIVQIGRGGGSSPLPSYRTFLEGTRHLKL